jgi:ubiquinone/menaquinone biosynthesis C-methylase UbiE
MPFCRGSILEVGSGLNKIFANSKCMDVANDPDYLCSIEETPVEDNTFDTIVMSHVLEHVESDFLAIRECHRILKPGGHLVVLSPGGRRGITTRKEVIENGHIRRYTRDRVSLLELPEFPCVYFSFVHRFYNLVWNRLKFVLKAFNYPIRLVDKRSLYERSLYRKILPAMMRAFDYFDYRMNSSSGNALFVFKKYTPLSLRNTASDAGASGPSSETPAINS